MRDNQSFWEHLEELRQRIIIVIAVWLVSIFVVFPLSGSFIQHLSRPVGRLAFLSPGEPLMIRVKLSLWMGALIALPVMVYQAGIFLWQGLKMKERFFFLGIFLLSAFCCLAGLVFADMVLIPAAVSFLLKYGTPAMLPMITASDYLGFYIALVFFSCLVFHIPLVMAGLSEGGLVSVEAMACYRRQVVVACFCVGAVLTPPDVVSQVLVAVPLYLIYEIGLGLAFALSYLKRGTSAKIES